MKTMLDLFQSIAEALSAIRWSLGFLIALVGLVLVGQVAIFLSLSSLRKQFKASHPDQTARQKG